MEGCLMKIFIFIVRPVRSRGPASPGPLGAKSDRIFPVSRLFLRLEDLKPEVIHIKAPFAPVPDVAFKWIPAAAQFRG